MQQVKAAVSLWSTTSPHPPRSWGIRLAVSVFSTHTHIVNVRSLSVVSCACCCVTSLLLFHTPPRRPPPTLTMPSLYPSAPNTHIHILHAHTRASKHVHVPVLTQTHTLRTVLCTMAQAQDPWQCRLHIQLTLFLQRANTESDIYTVCVCKKLYIRSRAESYSSLLLTIRSRAKGFQPWVRVCVWISCPGCGQLHSYRVSLCGRPKQASGTRWSERIEFGPSQHIQLFLSLTCSEEQGSVVKMSGDKQACSVSVFSAHMKEVVTACW